jgi:hypothetical protein
LIKKFHYYFRFTSRPDHPGREGDREGQGPIDWINGRKISADVIWGEKYRCEKGKRKRWQMLKKKEDRGKKGKRKREKMGRKRTK